MNETDDCLEAKDGAQTDAPVGGVDVVVVGEEGEARRFADAGRVTIRALVADEHLIDRGSKGEMVGEANVSVDGGGGGEVELAGWWRIRVGFGWCGKSTLPTGETRSDGDPKGEVLASVSGAKAEVGCKEGASYGRGRDRAGIGLVARSGDEVEVAAKRDTDFHAGSAGIGAAVCAIDVIGPETERGIEEEEVRALSRLDFHGVLEGTK